MARTTRGKGKRGFRLAKRLLSPVGSAVELVKNIGNGAFNAGRKVFGAGTGFVGKVVRSTGKRTNNAVRGLMGRRKTRRNRSRSRR